MLTSCFCCFAKFDYGSVVVEVITCDTLPKCLIAGYGGRKSPLAALGVLTPENNPTLPHLGL